MMSDNLESGEIDLESLLKAAGQSFTDAQKALIPGLDVPVNMILSNAELELKVGVNTDDQGKLLFRPISSLDLTRNEIDPAMLSTLRINFVSSVGELNVETPPVFSGDNPVVVRDTKMPDMVGLTLEEAVALLRSGGWQFEPHAAGREEIAETGTENRGRVLRQIPPAHQSVDKADTTAEFWVDLGNIPVSGLDGIGEKYGESLTKIGIETVGELSLANILDVAKTLHVNETRARGFIDMAGLMSRLAILGFRDEVVEVLVKGAGIRSVENLAETNAAELFTTCKKVIAEKKVKVPQDFRFTEDDVVEWVDTAKGYLAK